MDVRRRIAREIYLYRMVRDLTGTGGWYLGRLIMDGPKKNCSRDLPLSVSSALVGWALVAGSLIG
ncbi:hypothetical protein J6590_054011 [Homalodisca vitripennis]|nr:hypothetical protein J6590_054011 [Homalodisca vitripennis]